MTDCALDDMVTMLTPTTNSCAIGDTGQTVTVNSHSTDNYKYATLLVIVYMMWAQRLLYL